MYIIKGETKINSPGWMYEMGVQGWCPGKTQRDQYGEGGGRGDQDGEYT